MRPFERGENRGWAVVVAIALVLGSFLSVGLVGVTQGADCTSVSGGTVVTESGCYVLDGDVEEYEDGDYVEIAASDVILDGGGHMLDGGGNNNAVHVDGAYTNVTVRNLVVTDWDRGIFIKDATDATVRDVVGNANKHTVEFDKTASSTVVDVSADANAEYGVYLKDSTGTTVTDITVTNNGRDGLFVDGGDAAVENVIAEANTDHGVFVKDATGTTLRRVTAEANTRHGVSVESSPETTVADSTANDNGDAGVRVHHSDDARVRDVTADGNAHGVHLSSATTRLSSSTLTSNTEGVRLEKHVHTVEDVTVESSTQYGVFLDEADDNVIRASRINASGTAGILFPDDKPENNLIYDNYLNNSENVRFADGVPPTDWSVSRRVGTNVVGGSLVGGNYWAAPDGNGVSQLFDDADGDGFLDTSYTVGGATTDELPLTDVSTAFAVSPVSYNFGTVAFGDSATQSFTVENRVAGDVTVEGFDRSGDTSSFSVSADPSPVTLSPGATTTVDVTLSPATIGDLSVTLTTNAATDAYDTDTPLSASVTDVTAPTPDTGGDRTVEVGDTVTFDASGSTDDVAVDSYRWTFGDDTTASTATTTRTYETTGTDTVTLTVRDAAGNRASETIVVTVEAAERERDSETSGGEVGDAGGGVSAPSTEATPAPEPTAGPVIQTAETTVTADERATIDLEGDGADERERADRVSVTDIGFTPTVSERVSLRVTSARNLDGSPPFDRDDNTELLSNVRVDHSIDNADVSDVSVGFGVSKARLDRLGVPDDDVALYRYEDGSWIELPTTATGETAGGYTFRALSPGLSEFAVGAKQPEFALQTVRVAVDEIRVGDDVRVFVRITNDGGADGTFVANLVIDERVVESRELTIAAGGRRQVRFAQSLGEVGSYTVRVNDALAGEIIVTRSEGDGDESASSSASEPSATAPSQTDSESESGLGAVAVGVAAVLVLVGYYRRRS